MNAVNHFIHLIASWHMKWLYYPWCACARGLITVVVLCVCLSLMVTVAGYGVWLLQNLRVMHLIACWIKQ